MGQAKPERTAKDTLLLAVTAAALLASAVVRIADGPNAIATPLLLLAIMTSTWAAWRWYDREPDGRRGE
jgi:hypothetical protein